MSVILLSNVCNVCEVQVTSTMIYFESKLYDSTGSDTVYFYHEIKWDLMIKSTRCCRTNMELVKSVKLSQI